MPEQGLEATCWGCGLRLLLSSYTPMYKCGWCGAITNQNPRKVDMKFFKWRRLRDRCLVTVLLLFMLFMICGGVWAVYPVLFSRSYSLGIFHSIITTILSVSTISSFSLAAFRCAGTPPAIQWGSYPVLGKDGLENYTFCALCSKPKSSRTHHCRSCGMCVLDMDHHCPVIGNCVGAGNHRYFIIFLLSAVTSTLYVSIMSAYAVYHLWSPSSKSVHQPTLSDTNIAWRLAKDLTFALSYSAGNLSPRELFLVYLFIASLSVAIGLNLLLWQQLICIYQGKTYLSSLDKDSERDFRNFFRFFGCEYSFPFLGFYRIKNPHRNE